VIYSVTPIDAMPKDTMPLDIAAYLDAAGTLSAGKLCLEFANTADWHAAEQPIETLADYAALVAWAKRLGLLDERKAASLISRANAQPALAAQIYQWALELREAIYRIFAALAAGKQPAAVDIELINDALPQAFNRPAVVPSENGFTWRYASGEGLDQLLWPVLRSTAALLTSGEVDRVGQCADDRGCGYLFFDTSRNRSRRWCDMNSCGNRAKARRHYARARSEAPA
jgi:predicted RNA-binding Zn ribbon-like protein